MRTRDDQGTFPAEIIVAIRDSVPDVDGFTDCTATRHGAGQLADSYRIAFEYGDRQPGLASVFVKLQPSDEYSQETARRIGAFEREQYFYTELLPHLELETPRYLGQVAGPDGRAGFILSDMSATTRPLDQLADGTVAQATSVMAQIPRLQAPFWNKAEQAGGEERFYNRTSDHIEGLAERYATSWHEHGDAVGAGLDRFQRDLIARFGKKCLDWAASIGGPRTLSHQDLRLDNLLWSDDQAQAFLIDWQTLAFTTPAWDPAFFLGTALPPDLRREAERGLMSRMVDDLSALGVQDWSVETAWTEYRRMSGSVILAMVAALGFVVPTDRGFSMFASLIDRGTRQALDLDLIEFLN
ncbi:phosphotransferase [Citricoccus zhacaiensis]